MEINTNRIYTYPVLTYYSDDYIGSSYHVNVELTRDGYNLKLIFMSTLKDAGIQELIDNGKASFVYHLECAQTGYRNVVTTDKKHSSAILSYKNICGTLQICSFIVANESIAGYRNEHFHPDYGDQSFTIEQGCMLAIGEPAETIISKVTDDLSNVPSIFSIEPDYDETVTQMKFNIEADKIIIMLPLADYYAYSNLIASPAMLPVLNSMTVVPALIYALQELKHQDFNTRYERAATCSWYLTLKKVLAERFNCDIESVSFDEQEPIILAQKLINDPVHDAINALAHIDGGED